MEIFKRHDDAKPFAKVLRITIGGSEKDGEKVSDEENAKWQKMWKEQKELDGKAAPYYTRRTK